MHPPSVHPSISTMQILPENQTAGPLIVSNSWFKNAWEHGLQNVFTKESAAASAIAPLSCLGRRLVKIILAPRKKESSSSQIYCSTAHLQKPTHRSSQTTKRFSKHFKRLQKVWSRSKVFRRTEGWLSIDTSSLSHIILSQESLLLLLFLTFWFSLRPVKASICPLVPMSLHETHSKRK